MIHIGQRFGKWTVIERLPRRKSGNQVFRCRCECGIEREVQRRNLESGRSTNCGCSRSGMSKDSYHVTTDQRRLQLIKNYIRRSAIRRGLEYRLTDDILESLTQQPCHYCGAEPSHKIRRSNMVAIFQGLDRKDSNLGYLPDNVVPCCGSCNRRKGLLNYADYYERCQLGK